eukprot:gene13925-29624_t
MTFSSIFLLLISRIGHKFPTELTSTVRSASKESYIFTNSGGTLLNPVTKTSAGVLKFASFGLVLSTYVLSGKADAKESATSNMTKIDTIIAQTSSTNLVKSPANNSVVSSGQESFINGLVSGAITRISKEVILHPLDTIRARIQSQTAEDSTFENDPVALFQDLYSGLVPALVSSVPAGALFFGVKDSVRQTLRRNGMAKQTSTILAVAAANIPYWIVRCPAETLKTRQQAGVAGDWSLMTALGAARNRTAQDGLLVTINEAYDSYFSNYAYALPADVIKFLA